MASLHLYFPLPNNLDLCLEERNKTKQFIRNEIWNLNHESKHGTAVKKGKKE